MQIDLLYEDAEALVLDKPAGLPAEAPRRGDTSIEAMLPELSLGFFRKPAFAHRLDRDTSGCLLLARNPKALKRFMRNFENREVEKTYLAIVDGVPEQDGGRIDLPLEKVSGRRTGWRMMVDPKGKSAVTNWRKIVVREGRTLLWLRPETGRTHQLRVHCASGLGTPITGDPIYGKAHHLGMMLHAWKLHMPRDGKPPIDAESPYPRRFLDLGFDLKVLDATG